MSDPNAALSERLHATFAPDYASARQAFLAAAAAARAHTESFAHPDRGLNGEDLSVDLAWIGPRDAARVVVGISGTHGVEGLYGSGCQVSQLARAQSLPPDSALLLIHAINPHGFSWLRRVNEGNLDINRNFIDFTRPVPANASYDQVHALILPPDFSEQRMAEVQAALHAFIARIGQRAAAFAITGGQYTHADGIFYGGTELCWSNRTLARIAGDYLQQARAICVLDHHTGLGPTAHTELICRHPPDSVGLALARQWFGADVTSPQSGESESAVIDGNVRMAFVGLCPQAQVVALALEVGTVAQDRVLAALIADNWVHHRGDPQSPLAARVRDQMRAAFFVDDADWRDTCHARAMTIYRQAFEGLNAL